jgi:hypothetical protein
MEDLQIPKATMVGHSMGGRAMMKLALTKVPFSIDFLNLTYYSFTNSLL